MQQSLKQHCPDGIDVYFLISQYNATEPVPGSYNFASILVNQVRVEGFIVTDFLLRAAEALADLGQWFSEGKFLNMLFEGTNQGKLLVRVSDHK